MTAAAMAMRRVFMVSSLGCDLGAGILARQLYLCNMSAHGRGSEVRSLIVRLLARERGLFAGAAVVAAACAALGVPFEFVLFGLTLTGVALFHHHTLQVALIGLGAIVLYKLAFTGFKAGPGMEGLALHMLHEWVILANLFGLLLGFALLSNYFEASQVPAVLPRYLPDDWKGGFVLLWMIFVLSSFLDNIAAALIGGTIARTVFRGKVHIGYLAAIVAASNAGGSAGVVAAAWRIQRQRVPAFADRVRFADAGGETAGGVMADGARPGLRLCGVRQHPADCARAQAGRLRLGLSCVCGGIRRLDDLVRFFRRRSAVEHVPAGEIGRPVAQARLARRAGLRDRVLRALCRARLASECAAQNQARCRPPNTRPGGLWHDEFALRLLRGRE